MIVSPQDADQIRSKVFTGHPEVVEDDIKAWIKQCEDDPSIEYNLLASIPAVVIIYTIAATGAIVDLAADKED